MIDLHTHRSRIKDFTGNLQRIRMFDNTSKGKSDPADNWTRGFLAFLFTMILLCANTRYFRWFLYFLCLFDRLISLAGYIRLGLKQALLVLYGLLTNRSPAGASVF